jgi:DNA-binding CsgD family transcriptional regulator/PAS domain-containing protein
MSDLPELDFIGVLYDAAFDRLPWADVAAGVARLLESETSTLFTHDPVADAIDILGMHNNSADDIQTYFSTFLEHDLWAHEALRRRQYGKATLGSELVSDDTWRRSVIYNEFLRPRTDAFYALGAMARFQGGGALVLGCHRPSSAREFSEAHKARLDRLVPHLQRAAELRQQLALVRAEADGLRHSVDRLGIGVIHLDSQRRIVFMNSSAAQMLEAQDGLCNGGQSLRANHKLADSALQALLQRAAVTTNGNVEGDPGGYLRLSRPSGKPAYGILVCPMGFSGLVMTASSPAVSVFITDPDALAIDPAALSELYGLSPAEARVVAAIAMGIKPRDIASRLDIAFNTVRTLVARAMAKTEANSQLALMKMVLTGPCGRLSTRRPLEAD